MVMCRWSWFAFMALLVGLFGWVGETASAMTLVQNGEPKATIVVAEGNEKVKLAAEELQTYIEKISAAKLPIVTDAENRQGAVILVGRSKLTDAMEVEIPSGLTNARREEGFVILCKGDRLVLAGNNEGPYHGTEYAVYDFLERLGVRWFMPGDKGEVVPKQSTIAFADIQISEKPHFIIRQSEGDQRWGFRNKANPSDLGFGVGDGSVMYLVPPFDQRPELYAMDAQGKRTPGMICYSNPETMKAVAESIKSQFRSNPTLNCVGFAPPDGSPICSCPECKKQAQGFLTYDGKYDRTRVSQSEGWMTFASKVAEQVSEEFPDRYVATNGYDTRDIPPQGVKLPPNLVVMFAAIEHCTLHAYDSPHCWQKQIQGEWLKRWCELSNRKVWVFEYVITMMIGSLTPIPMVHKVSHDMPLMKKWGVMGYVPCHRGCWAEEGIATKYVRAKLEWNADADVEAILRDYYEKWYGSAAGPMRAYWDALDRAIEDFRLHTHENTHSTLTVAYTPELMKRLDKSIAEAEKKADTDVMRLHVKLDRLVHEHLKAYVAMEEADDRADYAEYLKQAQRMLDLRKEVNQEWPLPAYAMLGGEYAYTTEERMKEYQERLAKVNGETGDLVTLLPVQAMFRTDPDEEGVHFEWYKPRLEEKEWKPILTTRSWMAQGYQNEKGYDYDGVAWYRLTADVPASAKGKKIILHVPSVLNEGWCWVNGQYVGHAPYRSIWARPWTYEFDVTDQLRPGRMNQVTLRVFYGSQIFGAGGIFQRMFLYSPKL